MAEPRRATHVSAAPSGIGRLRIVLATSNPGKAREIREIFDGSPVAVDIVPMWLGDVETGTTYIENARLKAAAAMRMLHAPVLAEDAGLEIDALGGLPGLHTATFGALSRAPGSGKAKVLRLLAGVPDDGRTARFRAIAVLLLPDGRGFTGQGVVEGSIANEPRGMGGFGYDPIFIPAGGTQTSAELGPAAKNAISHRGQALRALLAEIGRAGLV